MVALDSHCMTTLVLIRPNCSHSKVDIDVFKLPRPHGQSQQSSSSVLTRLSFIAFILDGTDLLRPVGQSQRVYCLFNRMALFRVRYFGCIQFLWYHFSCIQFLG
jgi:hypothetical protein